MIQFSQIERCKTRRKIWNRNCPPPPPTTMGGPNLEIFKFSLYLFIPIAALVHFGDPVWYRENVLPYKDKLFPPTANKEIPTEQGALREELARLKARRLSAKHGHGQNEEH